MKEIRVLASEELPTFISIAANAYPRFGWHVPDKRKPLLQRLRTRHEDDPSVRFVGLFRDGQLLGGMRLHDFSMNLFGTMTSVGGVGMVAVDLLHKKQHVAKELLEYFLRTYRAQGASLALLYPFRPDFYRKMGFGYGPKKSRYRVRPAALPRGNRPTHLRYLTQADVPALLACYQRYARRTHGMIARTKRDIERLLSKSELRVIGYEAHGAIQGYMAFTFASTCDENFLCNDLHVVELLHASREPLAEFLTFLAIQHDQVERVVVDTFDDVFHVLLDDPRNGDPALIRSVYHPTNVQGVGLMYRVLDVPALFAALRHHNFGGQTCRLRITLEDTFLPENAGSTVVAFDAGHATVTGATDADVEIRVNVADLSSLVVGAVDFERLYTYGRAQISDLDYLETLQRLFAVARPPICMTGF
jgi:predicted acetyltransferase